MANDEEKKEYDPEVNARALEMIRNDAAQKRQQVVQPLTDQKNSALDAYLNRGEFKYDFNADALYNHYKDKYTQLGKMAMQDTMGQAAALTGGYGSSYAQSVGQQAYDAQLQNLNDVIPELYQMAYSRYQDQGNNLLQQYSLLAGEEADAYNRLAQEEQNAVADHQFNTNLEYQVYRDQESDAAAAAKATAESSKVTKEGAEAMALHGDYSGFAAYLNVPYEYAKTYYLENYGDPAEATAIDKPIFQFVDDDGLYHYSIGGKEVKYEQGINPNTGKANPDAVRKTPDGTYVMTDEEGNPLVFLDNKGNFTYQPNNIGGVKIEESGVTDTINGHEQNVWRKPDNNTYWMWDEEKNKYVPYTGYKIGNEVNTKGIDQFKRSIMPKVAFGPTASQVEYEEYIAEQIDKAEMEGSLTHDELYTIAKFYGFV